MPSRAALHVMIGNGDAYLKNWTVLHPQGTPSRLSPNYDLVCTLPYIPNDALALKLGGSNVFGLSAKRFQRLGRHLPMEPNDLWESARETAFCVHEVWRANKRHYPLRDDVRNVLDGHMDAMVRQVEHATVQSPSHFPPPKQAMSPASRPPRRAGDRARLPSARPARAPRLMRQSDLGASKKCTPRKATSRSPLRALAWWA